MNAEPQEEDPFPDLHRWAENRRKAKQENQSLAEHGASASSERRPPERPDSHCVHTQGKQARDPQAITP